MKKFLALFGLALTLASGTAWADAGAANVVNATSEGSGRRTATVFNDSGATLVSGDVVIWDNDDTEYDRDGNPYITTTTSADNIHVAGIMATGSCPDQQICEIVTQGWAGAKVTATLTEDTLVATSTTATRIGDYTPAANTCAVGVLDEYVDINTNGACTANQICLVPVHVQLSCQ